MGISAQPETLDQKIARLEAARSVPSRDTTRESLDAKIARLEAAPAAEATATRSPASVVGAGFRNLIDPFLRLTQPAPQEPETTGERIAGAISAGYQGATLGAGNKITAAARAYVLPESLGGTKGFDFPTALKENTQILEDYKRRHPLESLGLEVAGSLPTIGAAEGLLGVKSLGEGAGVLAKAKNLASTGAKFGGVTGGLSTNNLDLAHPQDALLNLAGNIGAGAATGAVLAPVVGPLAGGVVRGTGSLLRRVVPDAAEQLPMLTGRSASPAADHADEVLRSTLSAGGVDPANIKIASPQQTVLDLGSVPTMRAVRGATNNPLSTAGQDVTSFLRDRAQGAGQRIRTLLSDVTGYKPESFNQTVEQLNTDMSAKAKPLYAKAMAAPDIPTSATAGEEGAPSLGDLFQRPSMQKAVNYHNSLVAEQGGTPIEVPGTVGPVKSGKFSPEQWADLVKLNPSLKGADAGVSMETLHNAKLRLDEMIGFARSKGVLPDGTPATKKMLSAINDTRLQLLKIIDANNPAYATARATYAGDAASRDAYEAGRAFFGKPGATAADGAAELADLSPAEQEMWRRGGMTWLHDNLSKLAVNPDLPHSGRNVNIIQRLFGSEHAGERAKLLFGDNPDAYNKFLEAAGPEGNFPAVKNFFTGQSSTASQLAEAKTPFSRFAVYHGIKALMGGPSTAYHLGVGAADMAAELGPKGMSLDLANELGQRATARGPELQSLLDRIAKMPNPAARKEAMNRLLGGSTATGAGLLRQFSGQP